MHTYKVKIEKKWNKEILKYGFKWFHQEDTEDDQKPWFAQRYSGHYYGA